MTEQLKVRLEAAQKRLAASIKALVELSRLSVASAKGWEPLEQALTKLPDPALLVQEIQASLEELRSVAGDAGGIVADRFGSIEVAFIKAERARSVRLRELDNGWQLGRFTLEVDRRRARGRILYNRETLLDWVSIQSIADLQGLIASADKALQEAAIQPERRDMLLLQAYERAAQGRPSGRVSLPELFRAFRLELFAEELSAGSPAKRVKTAEFPLWAFLAVLDGHRAEAAAAGRRHVKLETGSQQDHSRNLAMVIQSSAGGEDHKTVCWATGVE